MDKDSSAKDSSGPKTLNCSNKAASNWEKRNLREHYKGTLKHL